ncbi:MAG: DUF308 domain-containing protein [Pseudonocardiaceae bacterium]
MATVPDPEEQDGRDAARRDRSRHNSEDTDTAFADIVAQWRTEPDAPRWPSEDDPADPAERAERNRLEQAPDSLSSPAAIESRSADTDDDHFEPPDPPPFPVPQPRTIGGVLLILLGMLLLIQPSLLSLGTAQGTPLGLLAVTAGIGWLVLGLRGGPPSEGWDDGARL